ncbi:hypothetical protein FPV67DRAFT_1466665 [Lyophyllum atratum]|nr:hypothetical protein FPV67DRAFT_1466665 [Lyophyllum atratum]
MPRSHTLTTIYVTLDWVGPLLFFICVAPATKSRLSDHQLSSFALRTSAPPGTSRSCRAIPVHLTLLLCETGRRHALSE